MKARILVVDDNEADHFLTQEAIKLKYPNIEFTEAYDGEQALEMLSGGVCVPDIILLDINMPRMNGHEFLTVYSENNTRTHPVVIMLTTSSRDRDHDMAMRYQCVRGFMVKPLSAEGVTDFENILGWH